ncbi:MAG: hypothetical protein U5L11_01080 [Arhodomonas sp.]|nr:hypothetical protein [Arhodomonas sp.]
MATGSRRCSWRPHPAELSVFELGQPASDELEYVAEIGNISPCNRH